MHRFLLVFFIFIFNFSQAQNSSKLDSIMDKWHLAAAKADYNAYFDFMNEDFVFLGTDPKERWTKNQFSTFCKPYFDAGKAWDFKAKDRHWNFSSNHKIAWFDENLDTWMEGCRGSGVLVKKHGQWKISQYNLTVLIENEKIQEFILLRKK